MLVIPGGGTACACELGDDDFDDDGLADVAFENGLVSVGCEVDDGAGEGVDVSGLCGDCGAGGASGHSADDEADGFGDGVAQGVEKISQPTAGAVEECGIESAVDLCVAVLDFGFGKSVDGAGHADHSTELVVVDEGRGFHDAAASFIGLIEKELDTLRIDPEIPHVVGRFSARKLTWYLWNSLSALSLARRRMIAETMVIRKMSRTVKPNRLFITNCGTCARMVEKCITFNATQEVCRWDSEFATYVVQEYPMRVEPARR